MGSFATHETETLKVLTEEYLSARQEVLLHLQLYKTVPTRNIAILTAVVGLLIPLLTGQSINLPGTGVVFNSTPWTDLAILFTISTIAFLLVFSVIALLFNIQVLGERCVRLEDAINEILQKRYLYWERFAHKIWSTHSPLLYNMPDAGAAVFFHLLVLFFAVALPLFVLSKILCGAPDRLLSNAVFFYTLYLFVVPAISIYVNVHTMGTLRDYCCRLFEEVLAGNDPPSGPSGLNALLIMAVAAALGARVFVVIVPQPSVCAYTGKRSASSAVARADNGPPAPRLYLLNQSSYGEVP